MEANYTHLMVILDRTGSMQSIKDDVIGGFNAFLDEQRNKPGRATITLVQFDSQDPFEVLYACEDVNRAPKLTSQDYVPRASTPLLDALGRGMTDLDRVLEASEEDSRPEHVLFVVITDGLENASREYRRSDIVRMMEERKQRGWQFVFLSADLDAIQDATQMGVAHRASLAFDRSAPGVRHAFESLACRLDEVRQHVRERLEFSDEDRSLQEAEQERMRRSEPTDEP